MKPKQSFEKDLSAEYATRGTHPFTRTVWYGVLKCSEWLDEDKFQPGDRVRVTVELIKKK